MAQSNKTRASIKNKLQTPLVVRDLLEQNYDLGIEPDIIYAMHETLSKQSAENALLSAAFIIKEIAAFETIATNDLTFLHLECDRIIERYCAREDLAEDNPELWNDSQADMMDEIAEDIEGFLDLTALCQLSFEVTVPHISKILDILTAQLQSNLLIIDEVAQALAEKPQHQENAQIPFADNVIMFPVNR